MAEKDEANLGGESTDRRKFLAGVAAATVAAGASEAYAAPIQDAGKSRTENGCRGRRSAPQNSRRGHRN